MCMCMCMCIEIRRLLEDGKTGVSTIIETWLKIVMDRIRVGDPNFLLVYLNYLHFLNSGSFSWGIVELHFSRNIWLLIRWFLLKDTKAKESSDKSRNHCQCLFCQSWNQAMPRWFPKWFLIGTRNVRALI